MKNEVLLHPEWRQAVADILAMKPRPGDLISRKTLEAMLNLPEAHTMAEFHARQLKWLQQFQKLRDELLTTHQIWLRANGAGSYEFVPPGEQTERAYSDYSRAALLKLKTMAKIAQNVRFSELSSDERAANANAQAKISMLLGMVRGAILEDKTQY